MKIYKVYCTLTPEKLNLKVVELLAKETPNSYKIEGKSLWDGKLLRKDKIMNPDTSIFRRFIHDNIFYQIYCLEKDVEEAKEKVLSLVREDFITMQSCLEKMGNLLPNK